MVQGEKPVTSQVATQIILSLIGVIIAFGLWMIKSWMTRVDTHIKEMNENIQSLKVSDAIAKENKATQNGNIDQLQTAIAKTNQDIGKLSSSIEKLWYVLQRKTEFKDERFSKVD